MLIFDRYSMISDFKTFVYEKYRWLRITKNIVNKNNMIRELLEAKKRKISTRANELN